jgi:hypothetical protein
MHSLFVSVRTAAVCQQTVLYGGETNIGSISGVTVAMLILGTTRSFADVKYKLYNGGDTHREKERATNENDA